MYKNKLVRYIVGFNRKFGLSHILLRLSLKRHKVICGKNLTVYGKLILFTPGEKNNITIGNNVTINSNGEKYNPLGYSKHCILRTNSSGKINIGNNVGISNATIVSYNDPVVIGDYATIGGGVKIINTDFHPLNSKLRKNGNFDKAKSCPIYIKENAFIGMGSIILKGVTIGANSIVGAGSVVTKNIPDGQIWGGNPATYIKDAE